jgi:hypothetical protein
VKDAEDKKHKTRLLEEQTLKEARDAANRSKIDLNSQKLILKKKERALRALLLKCLDHVCNNYTHHFRRTQIHLQQKA